MKRADVSFFQINRIRFNDIFSQCLPFLSDTATEMQILLAAELNLPLLLHCRDASSSFFDLLRTHWPRNSHRSVRGVLHCFTGTERELIEALDLGLHIGITGWISDNRPGRGGRDLAALLPLIPDDRLLIETDAPYVLPRNIPVFENSSKLRRNEPAMLPWVVAAVAAARHQSRDDVASHTTKNAVQLFGLHEQLLSSSGSISRS